MQVYPVIHMESNHQQQQESTHPRYQEPEYAVINGNGMHLDFRPPNLTSFCYACSKQQDMSFDKSKNTRTKQRPSSKVTL